jgi:hypothetical protein
VVGKDPVELEKYLEKKIALPEEDILQRVDLQTNVSLWGESRFCFNFDIWTTEVILNNALNLDSRILRHPVYIFFVFNLFIKL